jgi:hypothetical protein
MSDPHKDERRRIKVALLLYFLVSRHADPDTYSLAGSGSRFRIIF